MANHASILAALVLGLLCLPNHQAVVFPYHDPYHFFRAQPYGEQRFNFLNLRDFNSILVRTTVTSASTTFTFTVSSTCTRLAATTCTSLDATNTIPIASKVPFPTGFARSLPDAKEVEFVEPSQVAQASMETTKVPEARMLEPVYEPYRPYHMLDSSFAREIPILPAAAGRFLFSTTTITLLTSATTVTTTSTRTLTPGCSAPNYFTQCP